MRVVAGVEKWHRIALAAGRVDDAMHGRAITIVGPARDHVAEIDDVGVRQRIGMDPSGRRLIPDLQTAESSCRKNVKPPKSVCAPAPFCPDGVAGCGG